MIELKDPDETNLHLDNTAYVMVAGFHRLNNMNFEINYSSKLNKRKGYINPLSTTRRFKEFEKDKEVTLQDLLESLND